GVLRALRVALARNDKSRTLLPESRRYHGPGPTVGRPYGLRGQRPTGIAYYKPGYFRGRYR
ncbi:MAG: hypothetical protein U9R05_07535, partial [Chloroflexota bacterium]|nr:hypothetical protein [Chloroflexota bacterium]